MLIQRDRDLDQGSDSGAGGRETRWRTVSETQWELGMHWNQQENERSHAQMSDLSN